VEVLEIESKYSRKSHTKMTSINKITKTINIVLSLLVPTIIHAIYDFLIFTQRMEFVIAWVVFIIALYIICFILVKKSTRSNATTNSVPVMQAIPQEENKQVADSETQSNQNIETSKGMFCRYCGKEIDNNNYCPYCGSDNRDLESLGESFADGYEDGLEEK
jgi:uncharacterized membrane protein YvbJ